ncbi:hypothetical protein JL722_8780 [Aureococcus anophagefferens]|nr:hypothetical protein JL722_8780 [Aureococcus anophagefferens]
MGQGASAEEADATGYRVLGVQPNSPASDVGLVSFFDFVVAVDGSEDRPLPCVVYNLKSRQTRSVTITPTRNWGGQGMLGVTIRFDTYHKADEHLVLNDECTLHLDKPVEFYVYNTETDEVRVVVLLPTYSWGGGGCLGAAVAHGYLHRLPARCRESNGVSIEPERPVAPNARDAMAVDAPPPPPPPADVPPPQTEVPVA